MCLAFYNRLSGLVARLRLFHRERLKEQEALNLQRANAQPDYAAIRVHQEMVEALEVQTEFLLKRARLIRQSLTCFLSTIACLSICSLVLGLSVLWSGLIVPSVLFFIMGMVLLIAGVIIAMRELYCALQPVELESRLIAEIASVIEKISE